ncbi:MAG: hypothetical protein M5U09_19845 [Gammaproteobacteria bacterium]|nr:hypothetical protein [Gammaproteobacteria bacterium]
MVDGKLELSNKWILDGPARVRTRGQLVDGAITGIRADVALTEVDLAASNAEETFVRLEGIFYTGNGSATAGDYTGDVWAAVVVG